MHYSVQKIFYTASLWSKILLSSCKVKYVAYAVLLCFGTYIHTTLPLCPKRQQKLLRYFSETPTFYQNFLAMRNTADVIISDKPTAG
jgi:hypothetical protein